MKFNVEVEIDWIDEEGDLDSTVQKAIIEKVVEKVSGRVVEDVTKKATKDIGDQISCLVTKTYNEILKKEIVITDKWGDKQESYPDIKAMIKERFDKFLTEKVDKDGYPSTYGDSSTRFNWIIKKELSQMSGKWMKDAINEVTKNINATLTDDLKTALGGKIADLVDISSLLNKKGK